MQRRCQPRAGVTCLHTTAVGMVLHQNRKRRFRVKICDNVSIMCPKNSNLFSLLRSGVEDNDDDAGGSDDPRIESDMNRES